MSDQTEDTLPTDALEAEVAELIDEVERTAEAVEARLGDADEAVEQVLEELGDAEEPEEPTLDDDIAALIAEAERRTGVNPEIDEIDPGILETPQAGTEAHLDDVSADTKTAPEVEDAEDAEAVLAAIEENVPAEASEEDPGDVDPDVEAIVEEAVADAAAVTEGPKAATEAPAQPEPVAAESDADAADESLDDELAAEADDAIGTEIAGEIETVDLGEALAAGAAAEVAVEETQSEPPVEAASDDAVVEPAEAAEPGEPAPTLTLASRAAALLGTAISLLSSPLERLSVKQRDTIGWIALNVLFLAVCVWLYTLLR